MNLCLANRRDGGIQDNACFTYAEYKIVCNLSTVIAQCNWDALALVTKYNGTIHNNCCSSSYCRLPTGLFIQFCGSLNLMVDNDKFNVTRNHLLYLVFVVRIILFFFLFFISFHFTFLFWFSVHFLVDLFALCCSTKRSSGCRQRATNVSHSAIWNGYHKEYSLSISRLAFQMETNKKKQQKQMLVLCVNCFEP